MAAAATELSTFINRLQPEGSANLDLATSIQSEDWKAVVQEASPRVQALLTPDAEETDVEACFRLLTDVALQLPSPQNEETLRQIVAEALKSVDDAPLLRLRIASNVFNQASALHNFRVDVLLQLIDAAGRCNRLELLSSYFENVETLLGNSLTDEKRCHLYITIADVLEKQDSKSIKSLLFLEKAASTQKDTDSGKDLAVRCARRFAQQPISAFLSGVDFLANPLIQSLKQSEAQLFELIDILSSKTIVEFTAFASKAGSDFFKTNEIDEKECANAMTLLSLCALPTGFDTVSYATLAKQMQVDEAEVEKWVVKAITAHVVKAKVDQLSRSVVLTQTLSRGFQADDWKLVQKRLATYKKNVRALLDTVRQAKQNGK